MSSNAQDRHRLGVSLIFEGSAEEAQALLETLMRYIENNPHFEAFEVSAVIVAAGLLDEGIESLDLGVRLYNSLYRAGIRTVGQLCSASRIQLEQALKPYWPTRSLEKALDEIESTLANQGLQLSDVGSESFELLSQPIEVLELPAATEGALLSADRTHGSIRAQENGAPMLHTRTIGGLIAHSAEHLQAIPNFGVGRVRHVQEALARHGLSLAD